MNLNHTDLAKTKAPSKSRFVKSLKLYNVLYIFLFASIAYIFLFKVIPNMYQLYLIFVNYNLFGPNEFVGFANIKEVLSSDGFRSTFKNTVIIGLYYIIFYFPLPLLIALMLNEMAVKFVKRIVQSIIVIPNFISWVVVGGVFILLLSPERGPVNAIIQFFGAKPIRFMTDEDWFRTVLVISYSWKNIGYGSIIYLASLSSIDPHLYEAARVDGAGRMKQIWHITLPSIKVTILIVFLLQVSDTFNIFDQVLVMYNPLVYSVGDVIGTYSYRLGLQGLKFSQSSIISSVGAVISYVIFEISNLFSKRITGRNLM